MKGFVKPQLALYDFQWMSGLPKKEGYYLVWHNDAVTRYWFEDGFWYAGKPWPLDNNGIDYWAEIPISPAVGR